MALQVRAKPSVAVRSGNRRTAVVVRAQQSNAQDRSPRAISASLLAAAALVLTGAPALGPADLLQPAWADEDVSDENLTPYQRRQRELERRREMLRQTREQAEAKAGSEVAAPSTAEADAAVDAANAERRAAASLLASELKSSAAAAYENSASSSRYRGFGGFSSSSAPPPAAEPKVEPVAVEVKKSAPTAAPAKKVEEPKKQAQPAGKQKRRGPLPLFLAEVLVLGGFVGVILATTKYSEQTNKVLALAGAKGKELYEAAESAIAKAQQAK